MNRAHPKWKDVRLEKHRIERNVCSRVKTRDMANTLLKLIILFIMLAGLPWVGMAVWGSHLPDLMEFPPSTRYVEHAPFSFPAFLGLGIFCLMVMLPFVRRAAVMAMEKPDITPGKAHHFPWWGGIGLVFGLGSWILAWTRFPWFSCFQLHTFLPLWLSYILVINALSVRRKGSCLMTRRPLALICLFLGSMLFWWFFEYLNRFVQNWYYLGISTFSPLEYVLFASASFSTVLPAVLSTRELLLTFPFFDRAFGSFTRLNFNLSRGFSWFWLILSGVSLALVGVFPNVLFPMLWVSPLLIVVSLQAMTHERHLLSDIRTGTWTMVIVSAVSAIICGFFWEMWNYFSMAKWIYSIPYVQQYHLFEMPLLGYMGYLPFGLECALIGDLIVGSDGDGRALNG